jgi:hypothetical protein
MLSCDMLIVIFLNVEMISVVLRSGVMLIVILLNVLMVSVIAPEIRR